MTLLARKLSVQVTCGGGRHGEMEGNWSWFNNQLTYLIGKAGGRLAKMITVEIVFSLKSDNKN